MRKKRIGLCAVIGVLTLLFLWKASAEEGKLRCEGIEQNVLSAWEKMEGVRADNQWYDWRVPLRECLSAPESPDIFMLRTYHNEEGDLLEEDALLELSGEDKLVAEMEKLPGIFRTALVDEEGRFYGMPMTASFTEELYMLPEAWTASGYSSVHIPDSYVGLLDFLDVYAAGEHDGYCLFTHVDEPYAAYTYRRWLVTRLVCIWEAQATAQGKECRFTEPDFVALAARARDIGKVLDNAEREKSRKIPLFQARSGRGTTMDGSGRYTLEEMCSHRIGEDEERVLMVSFDLMACRADSAWRSRVNNLFSIAADHRYSWAQGYLRPGDILPEVGGENLSARFTREWVQSLQRETRRGVMVTKSVTRFQEWEEILMEFLSEKTEAQAFSGRLDSLKE